LFPYSHGFIAGLLSGTSIHLWYMPFIFANLVLFGIAQKHAVKPMLAVAGGIGGAIVLSTTMIWRLPSIQFGYPVAQYAHALPSIFIGIFFAYFYLLPKMVRLILLLLILIATFCSISIEGVGIPYLLAILTMLAIVTKPFEGVSIGRLTAVSQCTLGIYFIHIIVLSAIRKYEIADGALLPILAFAASTALVLLMSKLLPMQRKYWM
jgi:surface polysaccharide O-acyltransferase-like enzyme